MAKYGHRLPSVLEPVGDICVQVTIPAHPDYVALFVRAVRMLETNRLYERDEALSAKTVVHQWRTRTVTPLIEALAEGTGICQDLDGECLTYPPFANFISYSPQNPFTEPDLIPDGFLIPPFYVVGTEGHDLPNYSDGDVLLAFDAISLELSWDLEKTPRIEICLEGSGVIELHLLKIVQGGVAVISIDNPVDLGDIIAGIVGDELELISLNQDIVSLPPETAEEVIIEREIATEGEHIVYIYFLPTLDDSLIPLFFGGGLREISLCGNLRPCGVPASEPPPPLEGVTELKPEFQFTADCGLEYRLRNQEDEIVSDWQPVAGWIENFADCVIGANSMATKEDIRDGIYEAVNRLSAQVVSGRFTDIHVDVDGEVTQPSDGHVNVPDGPPDEPETPDIDEDLAAKAGACKSIVAGYNSIWADMNAWKVAGLSEDVMSFRLQQKYEMVGDAETDTFVAGYFLDYPTGHINSYDESLSGMLFCGGDNFKVTVADYVIESITTLLQETAFKLNLALADSQLVAWYEKGLEVPSTDYRGYPCTKIPYEEIVLDMATANAPSKVTNGVWKEGHRYLIETEGSYTDSDVPDLVGDAMYFYVPSTGVKTFSTLNLNFDGTISVPTQANVPYKSEHKYAFTVDKLAGSGNASRTISRDNGTMNLPNVTGTITVKITDLGQFAI